MSTEAEQVRVSCHRLQSGLSNHPSRQANEQNHQPMRAKDQEVKQNEQESDDAQLPETPGVLQLVGQSIANMFATVAPVRSHWLHRLTTTHFPLTQADFEQRQQRRVHRERG